MTVKLKLITGFGAAIFCAVGIGVIGWWGINSALNSMNDLIDNACRFSALSDRINIQMLLQRRYEKDFLLNIGKPDKQESYLKKFGAVSVEMKKNITILKEMAAKESRLSDDIRKSISVIDQQYAKYLDGFSDVVGQVKSDPSIMPQEGNNRFTPYKDHIHALEETVENANIDGIELLSKVTDNARKTGERMVLMIICVFSVGAVVIIILSGFISRSILTPLFGLQRHAELMKIGDMSTRVNTKGKDEIGMVGQAFNSMAESLESKTALALDIAEGNLSRNVRVSGDKDMLGLALLKMTQGLNAILTQVRKTAWQVTNGSMEISDSSSLLSKRALEQASSMEEISSSMTEVSNRTKLNAENATQAKYLVTQVRDLAENGNHQMKTMEEAMSDINTASLEISKIIKVIEEIAFQTNLLALNAAVEAARAGKYGKGFAVVAEEVRSLADRSAKAAKETAELISSSKVRVEKGTDIGSQTSHALGEIVNGVTKVSDIISEIASASNEQATAVGQISEALYSVDQITQKNTSSAEEIEAAAALMSEHSRELMRILEQFKLDDERGKQKAVMYEGHHIPVNSLDKAGHIRDVSKKPLPGDKLKRLTAPPPDKRQGH